MFENLSWTRIFIYVLVLIVIYIFVKLTNFRIYGRPVLSFKWRLVIAILFPVILVLGLVFGALVFGVVLVILLLVYLSSLFGRKRKIMVRF